MTRKDWLATLAAILLIPVLAVSLIPNDQIGNAYLIWGDRDFDLVFFGTKLPTTWLVTSVLPFSVAMKKGSTV